MNRLFIDLYADEDVDVLVADMIGSYGFDIVTTRDAGRLGATDEAQLKFAAADGRALLTHNRADFERLAREYFDAGREHYGIIITIRRTPFEIVRRLLTILNEVTSDEMKNQIRYI